MVDSAAVVKALPGLDPKRMLGYRNNLDFYNGVQWTGTARRRERRLVMNYAKTIVAKAAAFTLKGQASLVDPRPANVSEALAAEVERALRDVYEQNDIAALDFDCEVDCSVLGDGAYKVIWEVDEKRVCVTAPDVQGLYVWADGAEPRRVWRLAHRYDLEPEAFARMVTAFGGTAAPATGVDKLQDGQRRGATSRVGSHNVVEVWTDRTFEVFADGQPIGGVRANPYGWIPYVVYPNVRVPKQYWGESDLEGLRESQRELNRALSQLSMILEVSGNPVAVLQGVTKAEDIAVEPGAVWTIPESAKAYLLDLLQGGGVALHTSYVEVIYRTLHDLGESPGISFGRTEGRAVSGVALNIQLDPLIKKIERKRLIRAAAFRRRDWMVLQLLAGFGGSAAFAGVPTRVQWGELLPVDRDRLVANETALVGAGIHARRRAADVVGVAEPEAEFAMWLREQAAVLAQTAPPVPAAAPAVVGP